jgi:hypothetical protein
MEDQAITQDPNQTNPFAEEDVDVGERRLREHDAGFG